MTTQVGSIRERVAEIRRNNPCLSLADIGASVGLTRERIRQILKSEGLPTRHYVVRTRYQCQQCNKPILNSGKHFCSKECRYDYTHPWVECDFCHCLFRRGLSALLYSNKNNPKATHQHLFCSRRCAVKAWNTKRLKPVKLTEPLDDFLDGLIDRGPIPITEARSYGAFV